jgi:endonuclease III
MVSPFNTLQEQQLGKPYAPWRILVCCTLLNRTHGRQVRPMVEALFEQWPTPHTFGHMTETDKLDLIDLIRPLGFANRRSESLLAMSRQYHSMGRLIEEQVDSRWVVGLSGCGQYAKDSIDIFVYGKTPDTVSDHWLSQYVEWKRSQ